MRHLEAVLTDITKSAQSIAGKELYKMYLYGSCARKTDNEDSDIDVMIIIDNDDQDKYADAIDAATGRICVDQEVLLSVQITSVKDWLAKQSYLPYYQNIINEGVVLYDRAG